MDIYDSIHGEFWMNDPYYQEFEALHSSDSKLELNDATLIKSNVWNDQESLDPSSPMETSGCRHSCLNNAPEAQRFFLEETHKVAQEQSKPTEAGVELEVDPVSPFHDQSHVGEDVVRNVESAERPLDGLTTLQVVEASLEHRPCAGNEWIEKSELEHSVDARDAPVNDLANMATTVTNVNGNLEVDRVSQEIDKVPDVILDSEKELEGNAIDQSKYFANESHVAEEVLLKVVDQVAEVLPDSVVEQVSQVAEHVTQLSEQVIQAVEKVTVHGIGIANTNPLSPDEYEEDTDDEFEAYTSLDLPEFKGRKGLSNFTILQDDQGLLSIIYDFYIFMLKQSLFEFLLGMIAAPVLLSMIFTILYLPEFSGLALDENVKAFMQDSDQTGLGLKLSWQTVFQVFMFSVSLSTGLQPELSPFSPYTLVVANLNALFGQLIFVFLSGAVFARLSQPSQPVKCSAVALICPPLSNRRFRRETSHSVLLARYVLVGPQPCELVDVKVDLTYHYNTVTRSGTFFRSSQSLKLVI
ncbi:hypothetical protein KP509_01G104000 [Ceratopteris richardii]|nr:hypothetical protein KP509_01G104000 [Ceratopteris richardii]